MLKCDKKAFKDNEKASKGDREAIIDDGKALNVDGEAFVLNVHGETSRRKHRVNKGQWGGIEG